MPDVITRTHDATEIPSTSRPRPASKVTYTVKEVAAMLRLNLGGTYQLIRTGQIPAKRLGNRWVVPVHRFHAWLDTQEDEAAPIKRTA
jgi:excisionase family DNA binding protein